MGQQTLQNLSPDKQELLEEVRDLELKARYWKAQFELRYYTLEAEKVQPAYDEYLEARRKREEQLYKEYMEAIKARQVDTQEPQGEKTPNDLVESQSEISDMSTELLNTETTA